MSEKKVGAQHPGLTLDSRNAGKSRQEKASKRSVTARARELKADLVQSDYLPGALLFAGALLLSAVALPPPPKRLTQFTPIQVGIEKGLAIQSQNTEQAPRIQSQPVVEQAPKTQASGTQVVTESQAPEVILPAVEEAQKGDAGGKPMGNSQGAADLEDGPPDIRDLPYGPDELVIAVFVDWTGKAMAAEVLQSSGDLSADLLMKASAMGQTYRALNPPLQTGQKKWLTFAFVFNPTSKSRDYLP